MGVGKTSLDGCPQDPDGATRQIREQEYRPALFAGTIWQDYHPNPYSWLNSLLVHVLVLTGLLLPWQLKRMLTAGQGRKPFDGTNIHLTLPWLPGQGKMGGGGGGGDRSPTPASRGAIPEFSAMPLAPPEATIPNLQPLMPVQASLLGQPRLELPEMKLAMPWGDPTGVLGPLSNGPGTDGGIGTGNHGGVGPDDGGGYGPGRKAGYGGDIFSPGTGGVTAPVPIYKPEPAYSEEARKVKLQGMVSLWIVVDPQGKVADVRLAKRLGMGLDEKAEQAVRTWRFQPGMRNGIPVAVRVLVEVSFHLL